MTVPHVTGPLAQALARQRDAFNTRFVMARHANPRLDGGALLRHLAETVEPIVRAVAAVAPERIDAVTAALYDLSIELLETGLIGLDAQHPLLVRAWQRLLPAVPRLVAQEPAWLAGAISNAAHNLASTPGVNGRGWVQAMAALGPLCQSTSELLDCGKVLAWRCGMAHYRQGAIATARALPMQLAARALGVPEHMGQTALQAALDRVHADPWLAPAQAVREPAAAPGLRVLARAGAFRGFGGEFLRPPVVWSHEGELYASDGEHVWLVLADCFGVVLFRADPGLARPEVTDAPAGPARIRPDGTVTWGKASAELPELATPTSAAMNETTLAVTIASSHHVFLVGRAEA